MAARSPGEGFRFAEEASHLVDVPGFVVEIEKPSRIALVEYLSGDNNGFTAGWWHRISNLTLIKEK